MTLVVGLLLESRRHAAIKYVVERVSGDAKVDVLWLHGPENLDFVAATARSLHRRLAPQKLRAIEALPPNMRYARSNQRTSHTRSLLLRAPRLP